MGRVVYIIYAAFITVLVTSCNHASESSSGHSSGSYRSWGGSGYGSGGFGGGGHK
ncbi:hypothetical protein GCM10028811_22290 [Uliginosibacterium sediminicola]